jgi:hypothetical protein
LLQDRSLNLLFDVAKAVSTADALAETVSESPDILSQVLAIVERVLNTSVQKIKVKESGKRAHRLGIRTHARLAL